MAPAKLEIGVEYPLLFDNVELGHHHTAIFLGRDPFFPNDYLFAYNHDRSHGEQLMFIPASDCVIEDGKLIDRTTRYITLPISTQEECIEQREALLENALHANALLMDQHGGYH